MSDETTATQHAAVLEPASDEECAGLGKCHGCLKWCSNCGDVTHMCDARLRGHRCDEHPVPPSSVVLREARTAAERMIRDGRRIEREGQQALSEVIEQERARREYDRQMNEQDRRAFEVSA